MEAAHIMASKAAGKGAEKKSAIRERTALDRGMMLLVRANCVALCVMDLALPLLKN